MRSKYLSPLTSCTFCIVITKSLLGVLNFYVLDDVVQTKIVFPNELDDGDDSDLDYAFPGGPEGPGGPGDGSTGCNLLKTLHTVNQGFQTGIPRAACTPSPLYKMSKHPSEQQPPVKINLGFQRVIVVHGFGCTSEMHASMAGVHNLNLMAGKKKLGPYPRTKIKCFYSLKGCIDRENKLKAQNFGLNNPNSNLLRVTFGLQAVCYAFLLYGMWR